MTIPGTAPVVQPLSPSAVGPGALTAEITPAQRVRAIVAGAAGNLIEWYDFYIYAFMALYFAPAFFPNGDRTAQLLNVAGIYAAGFFVRPLGGWFFGRYADRHGRRAALVVSVLLMGGGALLIALLPTYATIGAFAPLLLLVARLAQGFSTGGQYGAAATYLSEVAPAERRGFYASFHHVTLMGGQLCALLVLMVIQQFLDEDAIRAWAWRIPFVLGAVVAAMVILLRGAMHETVRNNERSSHDGELRALAQHRRALFVVVSLTAGGAVVLYTFTTYMQKFLVNSAGMNVKTVSAVMTVAMIATMLLQPAIGSLSDHIGRRACLIVFAGVMSVAAVPLLSALSRVGSATSAFVLVFAGMGILSFYTAISGLFKAELFPIGVRALGVSLAHSVAAAVFGGSAEYVALWFKRAGRESWFFWYVAGVCVLSFVVALSMREPRRADMTV